MAVLLTGAPVAWRLVALPSPDTTSTAPATAAATTVPLPEAPPSWIRVGDERATYAVPRRWHRGGYEDLIAYREEGDVIASGRAMATSSVRRCVTRVQGVQTAPVAWAALTDPVESDNAAGVARATALAWARGYAGLPASATGAPTQRSAVLADGHRAHVARLVLDLGGGEGGCGGGPAEVAVVARRAGGRVVSLVVARHLDASGSPADPTYDAVLGSLRAG